jgi:hypothetical protein
VGSPVSLTPHTSRDVSVGRAVNTVALRLVHATSVVLPSHGRRMRLWQSNRATTAPRRASYRRDPSDATTMYARGEGLGVLGRSLTSVWGNGAARESHATLGCARPFHCSMPSQPAATP